MGQGVQGKGGIVIETLELSERIAGGRTAVAPEARQSLAVSVLLIAKPGIAMGVAVAGLAGMTLAGRAMPTAGNGFLCLMCILMAASGSAILNVAFETGTDPLMPRVSARTKALSRVGKRRAVLISLGLIALPVLLAAIFISTMTGLLILLASVSYTVLYTLYLKKRTPYGTVIGGIPGALPVLIGYSAVRPGLGLDGAILFLTMLLWQPPHFLALALKYKDEYRAAGLPVMPVVFGEPYTKAFIFIYASALPVVTSSLWLFGYCSPYFAAFAFSLGCLFLVMCCMDIVRTKRYGRAFASSILYIALLLTGVVVDVGMR